MYSSVVSSHLRHLEGWPMKNLLPFDRIGGSCTRIVFAAALITTLTVPLSANAFMRSVDASEIAHLETLSDSNFVEHYEHPELESFPFTRIYIEPITNHMQPQDIYDLSLRPRDIEALAEEFREKLLAAFDGSGLLTDEPDEHTLVISTAITDIGEFHQQTTGSHLANASAHNLMRGGAIMEMVWRAGPGGEIVLALRDGRTPEPSDPVTDRNDDFTDVRDAFDDWAADLSGFFGVAADDDVAMN